MTGIEKSLARIALPALLLAMLLCLASCQQKAESKGKPSIPETREPEVVAVPEPEVAKESPAEAYAKRRRLDSILVEAALDSAMVLAGDKMKLGKFEHEFSIALDSENISAKVTMSWGNQYSSTRKHLQVRLMTPMTTSFKVFRYQRGAWNQVVHHEFDTMVYMGDTLQDVNGDGAKDLVMSWYPSSGCCLRNIYNVYLYRPRTGDFAGDYEFVNPTFSPAEKMIRGIEYGQPGEAGIYKYKWRGERLDTLERIYPDLGSGGYNLVKNHPNRKEPATIKKLKSLPREYRDITDIAWVTGQ